LSTYDWLLFLHITGAFLLLGGGVVAGALNIAALRRDRPSEIVLLFGLIRVAVASIMIGTLLAFVFGLWLVHEVGYGYGDGWVIAAVALVVVANAMGAIGGRREERTAKYARELAARGRRRARSCRRRLRDPLSLALSYGSGLCWSAMLALMVWKPGA
jgi:uncharacterized membrane protein